METEGWCLCFFIRYARFAKAKTLKKAKKIKEAERRQTLFTTTTAPCGAARALQGALACRRSTAVLAKGSHRPKGSASGQASWDAV